MKRGILRPVLALLILQVAHLACAQGEFPLEYRQFQLADQQLISMADQWIRTESHKPSQLVTVPEGLSAKTTYTVARLGDQDVWMALDAAEVPKLFVDTDGDGDLAEEKALTRSWPPGRPPEFGPVSIKAAYGDAQLRILSPTGHGYLRVSPAGIRSGEVKLGEDSYRVAVVDANFDGRYDGVISFDSAPGTPRSYDDFAIDLSRDGQFQYPYGSRLAEHVEIFPLPKMIQVAGAYYSINVARDGSSISVEKVQPEFGTLDLGTSEAKLLLWSDSGAHPLSGSEGKWRLPVGRYKLVSLEISKKDETGTAWTLTANSHPTKLKNFRVRRGETLAIHLGSPLSAKTDLRKRDGTVDIGLSLIGRAGEEYAAGARKARQMVPAPKLKILDESGKVLASGSFEYG